MSSDERLALRAASGEEGAFEEIYDRYHQDLYRFCLAMVGNSPDAQDALQNTMVKVLRGLPGEKRQIKLRPWLYRIARNEAIEILRRRRDSSELEPEQMPVAAVTETAETRERLRTLLADLEQLPERQRAALVMRELSGLDFDQIGTAFGSSAAVARQTLYEARLSLRQLDAGREMRCTEVMQELSDADGRVTRRREIQAHLRTCADCRAFQDDIAKRHEDLAALAPLPIAASAGLLKGVLGSSASAAAGAATGGGLGGAVGAGAGKAIATSALVKGAATVAVVAVVGASAADRSGLIDVPLPGRVDEPAARQAPPASGQVSRAAVTAKGSPQPQSSPARGGPRGNDGAQTGGDMTTAAEHAATQRGSSRSDAGAAPPGGGYGRSASQRHGRPDSLPEASAKGQETAAAHKSEHAASPTGEGGANAHGTAQAGGASASKPSTPPKAEPAPPEPEPSSQAQTGGVQHGKQGAPPGLDG